MRVFFFSVSAAILSAGSVQCGMAPDDSSARAGTTVIGTMESDGLTFLHLAGGVFSSPVRWGGADWWRAAALGGGTAASSLLDNDIRNLLRRNQSSLNDGINHIGEPYGAGLNMLLLSAGGYLAGLAFDHAWIRETALLAGTAILLAATVSTVVKFSVGRGRPYLNEGHLRFKPFSFSADDYISFPSGHTIVAFAFSGVLAERIGNVWASLGLYGLAGATAFARVYSDHHWLSDVVFGAGISVAVSRSVVRSFEDPRDASCSTGLTITPTGNGVAMILVF
jgi:membrane-associated phospholipid phosphatase